MKPFIVKCDDYHYFYMLQDFGRMVNPSLQVEELEKKENEYYYYAVVYVKNRPSDRVLNKLPSIIV